MLEYSKLSVQQREILTAKGNILVSASAGSGKTTMMIEKVMTLLYSGADIRRILIMTFTNDAASEMKSRLIENIYKELRSNSKESAVLKKQLEYLPFANIGTMDSFWKILYQKYFAVIGKDPSCNIVEPSEGTLMLNQTIMKVFKKHIENNDEEFFKLAEALNTGRSLDKFSANILSIRNFMTAQVDEDDFIKLSKEVNLLDKNSPMASYVLENFRKRFKAAKLGIKPFIELFVELGATLFIEDSTTFMESVTKIINAEDFVQFCAMIKYVEAPQKIARKISKCTFTGEYSAFIDGVRALVSEAKDFAEAFNQKEQSGKECDKLLELLCETEKEYSQIKSQKNLVDFNDLSKFAVKILQDTNTRNEVKASFDYIFVDEYQDTNYRQESLLDAIGNGDNIFVVGDVKQAIYHFRNAEPAIFIERKNKYDNLKTGTNISLNTNYRSDKTILKFVDDVCGELMTSSFGGVDYKSTANFVGGAEYTKVDDLSPVTVAILNKDKDKKERGENSFYTIDKGEFVVDEIAPDYAYVAQRISEIVGSTKIYNSKSTQITTVNYNDIAILIRKWDQGYKIGEALKLCNIPFNILDSEKKDCRERDLLVDYLSILFNPTVDIPLVNVLLSDLYNFTPNELLQIRKDNTKMSLWESLVGYKGNSNTIFKVNKLVANLEKLKYLSSYCTVSELLQNILQDGYDAILLNLGVIGEINAFIQFIESNEINNSLEDFLEFYKQSYDGNISPKINNAVTITTIFKSKGLEYPIVFVPCLNDTMSRNRDERIIYTDKEFGVAIKSIYPENYSIKENFAVKTHKLKQKYIAREEMVRVLYVALTRAKNHLFLSGMQGKQVSFLEEASSIMDWIEYAKTRNPAIGIYFSMVEEVVLSSKELATPDNKLINFETLKLPYRFEEATKTYAKMSVSQVLQEESYEGVHKLYYQNSESISTDVGIAYHTVLQHLSYREQSESEVTSKINELVRDGILSAENATMINSSIVFGVLKWEVLQNNLGNKFYREQSFMLYTSLGEQSNDKTLIQGVIDLFIVDESKNQAVVIDFKVTNASNAVLLQRYKRQLDLYAEAVEKLAGVKVKQKYIYNLMHGCAVYI